MHYRKVFGRLGDISSLTNQFANQLVVFRLESGTFTGNEIVPPQEARVKCDADGRFSIDLRCNDGYLRSRYSCSFANERFFFRLPLGTTPIDISQLRLVELVSQGGSPEEDIVVENPTPGAQQYNPIFKATKNQTVFQLPSPPTRPQFSQLFINGVKLSYPRDYVIDGTVMTIVLPGYTLDENDLIEMIFD